MARKVWVDEDNHTIPMVCFGVEKDCLVLSPLGAKEIGESLLAASQQAYELIQSRVDQALLGKEKIDCADS